MPRERRPRIDARTDVQPCKGCTFTLLPSAAPSSTSPAPISITIQKKRSSHFSKYELRSIYLSRGFLLRLIPLPHKFHRLQHRLPFHATFHVARTLCPQELI